MKGLTIKVFAIALLGMPLTSHAQALAPVTVSISSPNPIVKSGGEVKIIVTVANVSNHVVNLFKAQGVDGHAEAANTIYVSNGAGERVNRIDGRPIEVHGRIRHLPRQWINRRVISIQPGHNSIDYLILTNLFDLARPGKYSVKVVQELRNTKPNAASEPIIEVPSNTIQITVTK